MKYDCTICKFHSDKLSNLLQHEKTGKHAENIKKFEKRSQARKKGTQNKTDDVKIYKNLVDDLSGMLKMQMSIMQSQADATKTQAEASTKSMSAIKYLTKHHTTAPPIKSLKGKELTKMITYSGNTKCKIEDIIIHNYNNKKLHKFIGNLIIDKYKTDEPDDQSVWMSDLARLSFIIRELKDGNSEWVKDKSGTKLTKLIITPLMSKIKEILIDHVNSLAEINNEFETNESVMKDNIEKMRILNEIIMKINLNDFNSSVLRFIAPEFNLNVK